MDARITAGPPPAFRVGCEEEQSTAADIHPVGTRRVLCDDVVRAGGCENQRSKAEVPVAWRRSEPWRASETATVTTGIDDDRLSGRPAGSIAGRHDLVRSTAASPGVLGGEPAWARLEVSSKIPIRRTQPRSTARRHGHAAPIPLLAEMLARANQARSSSSKGEAVRSERPASTSSHGMMNGCGRREAAAANQTDDLSSRSGREKCSRRTPNEIACKR